MSDGTKIEWADATLNYVNGCSLESPGCTNCYAMKQAHRFPVRQGLTVKTKGGMVWTGEVRENPKALEQTLAWKRGRAIFWNAHGDLFHPSVPDAWIDRQFAAMALTPQHRHMVLTKRSARMRDYFILTSPTRIWSVVRELAGHSLDADAAIERLRSGWPLPNVWLGVSVEDQKRADERIPDLLATPAAVRFISAEPLLGPVNLDHVKFVDEPQSQAWESALNGKRFDAWGDGPDIEGCPKLDWVIAGGESGPGARPMHTDWARSLRDQCSAAGVAFHFKQHGEWSDPFEGDAVGTHWLSIEGRLTPAREALPAPTDIPLVKVGKKRAGRLLDGAEHNAAPGTPA